MNCGYKCLTDQCTIASFRKREWVWSGEVVEETSMAEEDKGRR